MREKSTNDLREELLREPNLDAYLKNNENCFADKEIVELLLGLYQEKGISKAALARKAGISEVYLHQVFSRRRKPSRDKLLCICIGAEASLEETQALLRQAAYAPLYPKHRRDAIIIHGLLHGTPADEINDKLFAEQEQPLF